MSRHPEKPDTQIVCAGDNKQLVCSAACRCCANVEVAVVRPHTLAADAQLKFGGPALPLPQKFNREMYCRMLKTENWLSPDTYSVITSVDAKFGLKEGSVGRLCSGSYDGTLAVV